MAPAGKLPDCKWPVPAWLLPDWPLPQQPVSEPFPEQPLPEQPLPEQPLPEQSTEWPVAESLLTGSLVSEGPVPRLPPAESVQTAAGSREEILTALRERMRQLEGVGRKGGGRGEEWDGSQSNCPGLERLLPGRRLPEGALVEWLAREEASGAGTLALLAARAAAARGGVIVVLDRRRNFYPPAAAALGVKFDQLIVVRARELDDELWACDQALRCEGVAAVWGLVEQLPQRWFRRLQLAAEHGGGIGHLLRPARVRGWPSWAYAQFWVEPLSPSNYSAGNYSLGKDTPPHSATARSFSAKRAGGGESSTAGGRRWRVELARCHGLASGGAVEVELDGVTGMIRETSHEARPLYLASQLAHPTSPRRSARA